MNWITLSLYLGFFLTTVNFDLNNDNIWGKMKDYFVNRENEIRAFREALENLYSETCRSQVLLFHGASGMGKTWLTNRCLEIAKDHPKYPLTIYVDCHRMDMNLEKVFNKIHLHWNRSLKNILSNMLIS
jgi:Cdc6-like AAA superfamily ATPase